MTLLLLNLIAISPVKENINPNKILLLGIFLYFSLDIEPLFFE